VGKIGKYGEANCKVGTKEECNSYIDADGNVDYT
jgi:hypothetical protein